MGSLTFEIKEFIEKNIKLIENNDFDNFFYRAERLFNIYAIGSLADVFKTIGCNPLEYMTFIPHGFFSISNNFAYLWERTYKLNDEISMLSEEAVNTNDSIEKSKLLAEIRVKSARLRKLQTKRIKFSNRQRSVLLKKNNNLTNFK